VETNVEIPHCFPRYRREAEAMKTRTGYVYQDTKTGFWYARVTYTDSTGRRKDVKRRADNKTNAHTLLKKLINTLDTGGGSAIEAEKLTFKDLSDYYEQHYAIPAQYANGRKVAGLRSIVQVKGYIKAYREHFGKRLLKSITYDDLRTFRAKRLKTSTHQGEQRSLATVNREMAYLRRMLNIAERNGWIPKNPFKMGDALIHASDEIKRERILTRDEEARLLAACVGRRAHLRPIIIAALDTGCRIGELLKMRWYDIATDAGLITIQAFNTKTMRQRQVSITTRFAIELEQLWLKSQKDSDTLIFGIERSIRHAFNGACKDAGLVKIRMHDLRHTHATRLDDLGFSLAKIGGQLGHTVVQTTLRYVNRDKTAVRQVAAALDAFNAEHNTQRTSTEPTELVN
jgi:integrase